MYFYLFEFGNMPYNLCKFTFGVSVYAMVRITHCIISSSENDIMYLCRQILEVLNQKDHLSL